MRRVKRKGGVIGAGLALLLLAAPASATVPERVDRYVQDGLRFWQARGAQPCPGPVTVEMINDPHRAAGEGGSCIVRVNWYWLPPNPWGMDNETLCALVFHEVKHALPGGDVGGIDGQGHTADGLMAVPIAAVPWECRQRPGGARARLSAYRAWRRAHVSRGPRERAVWWRPRVG